MPKTSTKTLNEKLSLIQQRLVATKSQTNKHFHYKFRSCEDIFEALKTHMKEQCVSVVVSDETVLIGDRFYIKATATISDGTDQIRTTGFAREPDGRKDDMQKVSGATSSYARKYALNGLFAIDDVKDADAITDRLKSNEITLPDPLAVQYWFCIQTMDWLGYWVVREQMTAEDETEAFNLQPYSTKKDRPINKTEAKAWARIADKNANDMVQDYASRISEMAQSDDPSGVMQLIDELPIEVCRHIERLASATMPPIHSERRLLAEAIDAKLQG